VPEETEQNEAAAVSEYEKAFVRKSSGYSLYYMFDMDVNEVITFVTTDSSIMSGIFSGDFSNGIDMDWGDGWHETFYQESGSSTATLIDIDGFDWQFEEIDIETAQAALDSVQ
jgi:hypothetical protein